LYNLPLVQLNNQRTRSLTLPPMINSTTSLFPGQTRQGLFDSSNYVIKSIEIISQDLLGTLLDMSGPKGYCAWFFICWYISQSVTYFLTNVVIPGH